MEMSKKPDQPIVMQRSSINAMQHLTIKLLDLLVESIKEEKLPEDCLRHHRQIGFQEGIASAMQAVRDQCDEEGEYALMKWREKIRPIVESVVKQNGVEDEKALRKALLEARPDYVRTTSHMAKIWREEVKRSMAEASAVLSERKEEHGE